MNIYEIILIHIAKNKKTKKNIIKSPLKGNLLPFFRKLYPYFNKKIEDTPKYMPSIKNIKNIKSCTKIPKELEIKM